MTEKPIEKSQIEGITEGNKVIISDKEGIEDFYHILELLNKIQMVKKY